MNKLVSFLLISVLSISPAFSQTASSFKTSEYYRSRALDSVKAADAWSRGYTGKGVTIAILDSGLNVNNTEFAGRIRLTRDFTGFNNVTDTLGHGTAVAGLAAASRNGSGMMGVAFDANLIIGKITTTGITTGNIILQAINWSAVNNAKVINLSFNSGLSSTALNAMLIAPGVYATKFTNTGSIPTLNAYSYATALSSDSVLVLAAGNDSTPWVGTYGQLATAADKNGNLIMGGKVIVAGNWNSQTNTSTGPGNNGAAHLCQYVVSGVCQDRYQTWQFYILAPGTGVTSTGIGSTGLSTMTGTSMAAPTVSGAAAIIRQMWPQLNAADTVQILLQTANKNITGYNKYLHGQGLLDLEMATRPVGTVSIASTTSLTGARTTTLQPVLITASGSASTAGAQSLMVLDDFNRDFYLSSKNLTAHYVAEEADIVQVALPYFTGNPYTQFNQYNDYIRVKNGNASSTWYFNNRQSNNSPAMGEISYAVDTNYGKIEITSGMMVERDAWLGNYVNGFNSKHNNKDSLTQYAGINIEQSYKDIKVRVGITNGITATDSHSDNIRNIGPVLSYSWNIGIEKKIGNGTIGIMTYQPVSVYHAEADLVAPVGLTEDFEVIQNSKANLAADVRELRSGAYYKVNNFRDTNLMTFVEYRRDYRGQNGVNDIAVGLVFTKKF